MTTTTTTPEGDVTVDLWGFVKDDDPVQVGGAIALTFGELVKLATPIVEHYQSDLYHDAIWLNNQLRGPGPHAFTFACDAWGTNIGTDQALVCKVREHAWQCIVYVSNGRWKLNLHKVQG